MNLFGSQLQKLRSQRGISISVMSKAIGIDRSTIYRWERNLTSPKSHEIVMMVADFFHISPDYFFKNDDITEELQSEVHQLREELNSLRQSINKVD